MSNGHKICVREMQHIVNVLVSRGFVVKNFVVVILPLSPINKEAREKERWWGILHFTAVGKEEEVTE